MKNNKPKTIQIDYDLFRRMFVYIITHIDKEDSDYEIIMSGLGAKFEAMQRRELYSIYKSSCSVEAKEKARQEYLNMLGVPESFRWAADQDVNLVHSN